MDDREKINRYRTSIKNLSTAYHKARGSLDTHMKQLKEKFKVSSVSKAKELLTEWKAEEKRIDKELRDKIIAFEDKYDV